jgi:hypothetical protein
MTLAPLEKNIVATETLPLEAKADELMAHDAEDSEGELTPELRQRLLESRADFANGVKRISMEEVLAGFGLTMDDFPQQHRE